MIYSDGIQIDLSKGKETYTDYNGLSYFGHPQCKRERVFEIFRLGEYCGTIKVECEDINKNNYLAGLLRREAVIRFPGMVRYPAHTYTITNPQPWGVTGDKTMSVERGGEYYSQLNHIG